MHKIFLGIRIVESLALSKLQDLEQRKMELEALLLVQERA